MVKFSIATDRDKDTTDFFDCFLFVGKDSKLPEYLKKGKQVFIDGTLQQERWESDGQKRSRVVIKVDNLVLLGGGGNGKKSEHASIDEDFEF